jgi:hypothetical protein
LRQSCNSVRGTNPQFVNPYGAGENLLTHCVNFTFPDHRKMLAPVRPLAQPTASHKMRMSIHSSLRLRPPPEEPPEVKTAGCAVAPSRAPSAIVHSVSTLRWSHRGAAAQPGAWSAPARAVAVVATGGRSSAARQVASMTLRSLLRLIPFDTVERLEIDTQASQRCSG